MAKCTADENEWTPQHAVEWATKDALTALDYIKELGLDGDNDTVTALKGAILHITDELVQFGFTKD